MKTQRVDYKFAALCLFVLVGCLGGWAVVVSCAVEAWYGAQEPQDEPIAAVSMDGGWEPVGRDPDGSDHLRRTASNGDEEGLMILPNGTGLYMRCPAPVTEKSECVKILLRPRP